MSMQHSDCIVFNESSVASVIAALTLTLNVNGPLNDGVRIDDIDDLSVFVLNRRALSSSSVDGVCAMLNHACTVLEQEFREILYARLRLGFPSGFDFTQAYNLVQSSIQQGKLQRSDQETQKAKNAFLVSSKSFFCFTLGPAYNEQKGAKETAC